MAWERVNLILRVELLSMVKVRLWVVDSANGRVMRFNVGIPEELDGME